MFRLTQTIRNLFIRFEGLLYQVFNFIRNLFGNVFGFFSKLLGYTEPGYYLESDQAQGIKPAKTEELASSERSQSQSQSADTRRRPDAKLDYYRNLAQQVKKS